MYLWRWMDQHMGKWALNCKLPFVKQPRVIAMHVLDGAWLRGPFRTRPEIQRIEARSAKTLRRAKQQMAALKLTDVVRKPLRPLGKPAEEIMKATSEQGADLIVMGAKGLGAIGRFVLGSVSTRVVQHANCAVLVVQ